MVNLLPAILIGGPPHAGKSVLTYALTQALRKRNIDHYVIRACPDGEGDWSQEADQSTVRLIRVKGRWTPDFVKSICRDLERRHFPLLVDMGGRPEEWQTCIFRHCTHSLLLLHPHEEQTTQFWHQLVVTNSLLPLAQLYSELEGTSTLTAETPVVEGTLTGLNRNSVVYGPVFEALVERVASLFTSYSSAELRRGHFETAPEEAVDLDIYLHAWAPELNRWEPQMLPRLLAELPQNTPLAIYGRGTNWLYGSLAVHCSLQPFYQFDSRLGWITPPSLQIGEPISSDIQVTLDVQDRFTILKMRIVNDYLDYTEAGDLAFPSVSTTQGLILSGKIPHWLVAALVRLYFNAGVPWIACYHPQLMQAVVVASVTSRYAPGNLAPIL
jgi:CRISPR-associated protein Csx3